MGALPLGICGTAASYHQQRVGLPRTLSSPRTLAASRPLWYGCLALGFLARCGAGFSPALHRAPHPARGPILPGLRSHPGTDGPLCVKMGSAHSSLPGPAYRRAQGRCPGSQALEICARLAPDSHPILTRLAPILSVPTRTRFAPEFHSTRTRPIVEACPNHACGTISCSHTAPKSPCAHSQYGYECPRRSRGAAGVF